MHTLGRGSGSPVKLRGFARNFARLSAARIEPDPGIQLCDRSGAQRNGKHLFQKEDPARHCAEQQAPSGCVSPAPGGQKVRALVTSETRAQQAQKVRCFRYCTNE